MRISTANAYDNTIDSLMRRGRALGASQEQLTSLKRINRASDDPTGAARAERAVATLQRNEADQRALEASRVAMTQTESALGDANELMQQARDAILAAGNGSYTDAERKVLAQQIRGVREQLLATANRGDGAGSYLFGGQGSAAPPFVDGAGGVTYAGASGQTQAATRDSLPLNADGRAIWLSTPDVFALLRDAADDLEIPNRTQAQIAQTNATALQDLDAALARVQLARSEAGEVLNRIDSVAGRLADEEVAAKTERSAAEDLDMVKAVSDFQNQQTSYDAALKSYALVQRMSLFTYLS
jgi:flagellar hook-associated protein 3 FlgL